MSHTPKTNAERLVEQFYSRSPEEIVAGVLAYRGLSPAEAVALQKEQIRVWAEEQAARVRREVGSWEPNAAEPDSQ